jgi:tRNA nucleotidyltransferase (CCA-adding enzyme)
MLEAALKIINKIEENGYKAYIVGGFVRDYLLGIESSDVDICTSAKPMELVEIFEGAVLPKDDYGSVSLMVKNTTFQITTFRTEIDYLDYRHPEEIEYVNDLNEDLIRRDFTINTICMDKDGKIIDRLGGRDDLNKKIIRTVGKSFDRFHEDALRILRAIRFSTKLDFELSDEVKEGIIKNKKLLDNISYSRKKEELDKIFTCSNARKGIDLLMDLGLDEVLGLRNLDKVEVTESLIGIWSIVEVDDDTYPFTNNEKELISKVREAMNVNNLDPYNLYKYGLYVNSTAGILKGISREDVARNYEKLVIQTRKDLDITSNDIIEKLGFKPGPSISKIYTALEKEVLYRRIDNNKNALINYCLENFSSDII